MNFTGEIKRELMRSAPGKACCRRAMLSAALATGGKTEYREGEAVGFSFTTENEACAAFLMRLFEQDSGASLALTGAERDPKHGRDKLTLSYLGEDGGKTVAELAAFDPTQTEKMCCKRAYLSGAFLFGGSCTLPRAGTKTGYHLQFSFSNAKKGEIFQNLLDEFQLFGNAVRRGEACVIYIKSREGIGDFLSAVEASAAFRRLESVTAAREENNRVNRVENCTAGNADRAAIASAAQIRAIEKLQKEGVLQTLSPSLRETALARIESPTLSLAELADRLCISKSCLTHRLHKLTALAEA